MPRTKRFSSLCVAGSRDRTRGRIPLTLREAGLPALVNPRPNDSLLRSPFPVERRSRERPDTAVVFHFYFFKHFFFLCIFFFSRGRRRRTRRIVDVVKTRGDGDGIQKGGGPRTPEVPSRGPSKSGTREPRGKFLTHRQQTERAGLPSFSVKRERRDP